MPEAPISAARFAISVDGVPLASFSELQGIATEIRQVDFDRSRESETVFMNRFVHVSTPIDVRFVRPRTLDMRLVAWHRAAVLNPAGNLKNCFVTLYGSSSGKPVARYHLESAWPSKIEPALRLVGRAPQQMETVRLTCDHLQRVSP